MHVRFRLNVHVDSFSTVSVCLQKIIMAAFFVNNAKSKQKHPNYLSEVRQPTDQDDLWFWLNGVRASAKHFYEHWVQVARKGDNDGR